MVATSPSWTSKTVATEPSAYIQSLNAAVTRFSNALKTLSSSLSPPAQAMKAIWVGAMTWISSELLEGLAGVQDCSEEGRSQMLLDVQSAALLCETESGIRFSLNVFLLLFYVKLNVNYVLVSRYFRPFVKLNLLVDYIQAFFVPTREWSNWLECTGVRRYTQRQSLGLANCLARGDKHLRQRLLATVTTVYARHNQPGVLSSTSLNGVES